MFIIIILGIILSLSFAYYFHQKRKIRMDEWRERMEEKQEELLQRLREQNDPTPGDPAE
ncbi:MAG TPA: hypothetical protein VHK69_14520 [Chitinophagaceae bacterium]|jgi:uncharacterized membrane protein (DUF106 family)|nr:hypothetical protein [Chitinophagaceae bacterium]